MDVSGLTLAVAVLIPGNVLKGNFKQCVYISEEASDEQFEVLLKGFGGKLGGPLKDLADLVGEVVEVVEVKRAPISFEVKGGGGRYTVGDFIEAEMEPYRGPTGEPTTLVESIFSTVPGSPAYVAKAHTFKMNRPQLGLKVDLKDHNAIQGTFVFKA